MADEHATVHVDLLVLGFGKGGKTLAGTFGRLGKRVAMVEQSDQMYGGTCINIGCVPTKALVHDAEERRPGDDPAAWYEKAVTRKNTLTAAMRAKNFSMLDDQDSVTVITGHGTFVSAHEVEVTAGDDVMRITANTIIINTGSEPIIPNIDGIAESTRVVTSTDAIASASLPRRLVIVGGGYIGVEFAGMYSQFGSQVTVLESAPRVLNREDDDVADTARAILEENGVTFVVSARVTSIRDEPDGTTVTFTRGDSATGETVQADAVLVASGRRPATEGLGLERAGIRTTDRGAVAVDEHLRTSAEHVFAVGDVNGGPQFTYISLDDNRIVLNHLTGDKTRSVADRVAVPYTVFMTPSLSRVGLTEAQARDSGRNVLVAAKPVAQVAAMPRAKIVGESRGLMKFVVDADSDQILGAALLSYDSHEVINTVALAMRRGAPATELREAIYTHPSMTEGLNEVLAALA